MKLSIVIVNYNVKHLLEECLKTVCTACTNIEAEIFVIDNASTDGSKEYFQNKFQQVQFIWSDSNLGFAKANNRVLSLVTGSHILFLNPDTLVPADCFEQSLRFFQQHPDAGAIGVRMVDGAGKFLPESKRGLPNAWNTVCKMMGGPLLFPNSAVFAGYYAPSIDEKETGPVAVLSGAFLMVSKECLEAVKGFDEDFFMYGEDIDISCRIEAAGFINYYVGNITITHLKGSSTQKSSSHYTQHFFDSMRIFVQKHYSRFHPLTYLLYIGIETARLFSNIKRIFFRF